MNHRKEKPEEQNNIMSMTVGNKTSGNPRTSVGRHIQRYKDIKSYTIEAIIKSELKWLCLYHVDLRICTLGDSSTIQFPLHKNI